MQDEVGARCRGEGIGGSAPDTAKAGAGRSHGEHRVMDYLDGMDPPRRSEGPAAPCIVVATPMHTGLEATKNAMTAADGRDRLLHTSGSGARRPGILERGR